MTKHKYINNLKDNSEIDTSDIGGIVTGSEYCFFLLPDDWELERACDLALSRSVGLTIMVPYLRERQVQAVIDSVKRIGKRIPVRLIVNDWGAASLFSKEVPEAGLALGRLLSGQKSCVLGDSSPYVSEEGMRLLNMDLHSSERGKALISLNLGVEMVSVNLNPLKLQEGNHGGRIFHYPYSLVTVTDYCPYRENRPSALLSSCDRPCRKGYVVLSNDSLGRVMYQRGKGRFFNPFPDGFRLPELDGAEVILYDDIP